MGKIKHTKNELKKQKDDLKRFERYLPTLLLKKQQLQMEIHKIEVLYNEKTEKINSIEKGIQGWVECFGEEQPLEDLISVKAIIVDIGNIEGIVIPLFLDVVFQEKEYDLFTTPLWIDRAFEEIKKIYRLAAELKILDEQIELLKQELRVTSQRVNLFEKVKIPETKEHIRVIRIFLGDEQTASVVRGKIAKNKLVLEA